ncbi:MAG TPA: hypothetical protein DCL44_03765 [Elusimicrobia bacterium]|nr:hypothetical protein [Elusimicrobiota bacterium]
MTSLTQNCTLFGHMPTNFMQFLNAITTFVAYFNDETLSKNGFFSAPYIGSPNIYPAPFFSSRSQSII